MVIHVSNNPYDLVPSSGFGSRPTLTGGALGVVAVVSTGELLPLRVLRWECGELVVESADTVAAGIDGESVELTSPVRFESVPRALRVRVPNDAPGLSPAALKPAVTGSTLRRLLLVVLSRPPVGNRAAPDPDSSVA